MLPTEENDLSASVPPASKRLRPETEKEENTLREEVEALKSLVESLREEVILLKTQLQQPPIPPKSFKDALNLPSSSPLANNLLPKGKKSSKKSSSKNSTQTSKISETSKISLDPLSKISEAPSVKESEWTQVKSKQRSKMTESPAPSLKEALEKAPTPLEKLKILLKPKPISEDRSTNVSVFMVSLPLSKKAQSQPIVAWKQVMESITGHRPVSVSLIHPWKGEVMFDSKYEPAISKSLQESGFLIENHLMTDKDLARRSEAYLNGYYLPLRRAALSGFSMEQQLQLLELAGKQLQKKFTDPIDRKKWKYHIAMDQKWVEGMEL
jgi:hypothetical protein